MNKKISQSDNVVGYDSEGDFYMFCGKCSAWYKNGKRVERVEVPLQLYVVPGSKEVVWREWPR